MYMNKNYIPTTDEFILYAVMILTAVFIIYFLVTGR